MTVGSVVDVSRVRSAHKRFLEAHETAFDRVLDPGPILRDVKQHIASGILLQMRTFRLMHSTDAKLIRTANRSLVRVTNTAKYAWAQEKGSGKYGPKGTKYPITPKRAGYPLRFYSWRRGTWVSTYKVMHPGVKPTHFLEVATDLVFQTRLALLRAAMNSAARHF